MGVASSAFLHYRMLLGMEAVLHTQRVHAKGSRKDAKLAKDDMIFSSCLSMAASIQKKTVQQDGRITQKSSFAISAALRVRKSPSQGIFGKKPSRRDVVYFLIQTFARSCCLQRYLGIENETLMGE